MQISSNIIRDIVRDMSSSPRFEFGDWTEISNDLSLLAYDKTITTKYPLIIMHSNYEEQRSETIGIDSEFTTTFYLVAESEQNYTTQERLDNVFEPTLFPLHDEFLLALYKSKYLTFDGENSPRSANSIPRITQNLYFLTGVDAKQNKINEVVDALSVEITIKVRRIEYKN